MPRSVFSTVVNISMLVPFALEFSGYSSTVSQMSIMNFRYFHAPSLPNS